MSNQEGWKEKYRRKKRKKSYNLNQLCKQHQHIKENWGKGAELMQKARRLKLGNKLQLQTTSTFS